MPLIKKKNGSYKKGKEKKSKAKGNHSEEEKSKAPLCLPTPPRYLPLAWGKAACLVAPQAWGNPLLPPAALIPHLLSRAQHIPTETMQKRRGERVHGAVERHGDHPGGTPSWRNPILEETLSQSQPHPGGNPTARCSCCLWPPLDPEGQDTAAPSVTAVLPAPPAPGAMCGAHLTSCPPPARSPQTWHSAALGRLLLICCQAA